jgi:formiminotetrahydrofolate cyclodeaminase
LLANEFDAWLERMATKPLPGGVAAAALAAAMGAALGAKVAERGQLHPAPDRAGWRASPALAALAQASAGELVDLAVADEAAYRLVLDTRHLPDDDQSRRQAWQQATEIPLSLAECCRRLLADLPRLEEVRLTGVAVDLQIGRRLLEAGAEAGLLAAGENLGAWGAHSDATPYARRLAALIGEEEDI